MVVLNNNSNKKGITLIALVITIIVLLILAGISITMLSGDNGLLKKAGQARDDTIIGEEREQVELAYISVTVKKLGDDVTYQDLQDELDTSVGTNKTKVTKNANNTLNVLFKDTENNYNVDNGKVAKVDDNTGDTTTDIFIATTNGTNYEDINWDYNENDILLSDGTKAFYLDSKDNYCLYEYSGKIYKLINEESNYGEVTVVIGADLTRFGVQEIEGIELLITPSTSDHIVHESYTGPSTYYDEDGNEFTGYCAADNDGYYRYYNTSGALVRVEQHELK